MSGLPDRPDLDQLRRQARELLRAAAAGDPHALGRLAAVSPRVTLSAAQLALAREYGFPNWTALKAEVARRRLSATPADRWSFGGAAELQTPAGILFPEILIAGADHAALYGTVTMSGNAQPAGSASRRRGPSRAALLAWLDPRRRGSRALRREADAATAGLRSLLAGVTVTDDLGAGYALLVESFFYGSGVPDMSVRLRVQPVPAPGTGWLELHGRDGATARLLRSSRATARISPPRPAGPADGFSSPDSLSSPPGAPPPPGGPRLSRDIGVALPAVDGLRLCLDSLACLPGRWQLYLRAWPGWRGDGHAGQRGEGLVSVRAEDDRGHSYLDSYAGGTVFPGAAGLEEERLPEPEELALRFLPHLDPLARSVRLTFRGAREEVTADLELGTIRPGR